MTTARKPAQFFTRWAAYLLALAALLALWEYVLSNPDNVSAVNQAIRTATGWNPRFRTFSPTALPRPSSIVRAFLVVPGSGRGGLAYFWQQTEITLLATIVGYALGNGIAFLTATVFLYSKPLERAFMPIALALRSIPLVAITPLLLRIRFTLADLPAVQANPLLHAVFGTEHAIKMFIVVLIVYFPTLVNVLRGLQAVDASSVEFMQSLNASPWHIFWKLRVPTALPLSFAALKVAASASVMGVVVAEWLSSNSGLGYVMYQGASGQSVAEMWVAMLITTALSVLLFWLVGVVEKAAIPWHESVIALKRAMEGSQPGATVEA